MLASFTSSFSSLFEDLKCILGLGWLHKIKINSTAITGVLVCATMVNFFFYLTFQMEQVLRVERMRQAILENLHVEFAKPLLPGFYYSYPEQGYPGGGGPMPYGYHGSSRGRGVVGHMGGGPPGRPVGRGRGILGNYGNEKLFSRYVVNWLYARISVVKALDFYVLILHVGGFFLTFS